MASSGDKALSGAASGAAAGATFGPWGAAIGGLAGGAMGYLSGDDPTAPKPVPAPMPSAPGAVSTQYGGVYFDPATQSWQQVGYGFDPTSQGRINDADMMYNQFMGLGNDRLTGDLDVQINELNQQISRLQGQQGGKEGVGAKTSFADFMKDVPGGNVWVGPDGGPPDMSREGINRNEKLKQAFRQMTASHGGTYGSGGDDYYRWANDMYKEVAPKIEQYKQESKVGVGNEDARNQAIQAFQAKLGYLTKEKERVTGGGTDLSKNPLMKYLDDVGGGDTLGTGGGTPSWLSGRTAQMDAVAEAARARSQGGPMDTSGIDEYLANQSGKSNAEGLDTGYAGSINAPRLDMTEAGQRARMLNAQTDQQFGAQRNLADQQAAHRGLLSSSINEIGRTGDTLQLANAYNQNALGATQGYNQAMGQQYGMDLNAAQFGADQRNQLFGRELGKAQFANQESNQQFSNLLGAGQLRLSAKGQADQQANWGDTFANQTSQNAIGNQWQLYGQQRAANTDAYSRNLGMYNLLNQQSQQARGNTAQDYQLGLQGANMLGGYSQNMANNMNQMNTANTQMQNSSNMAGWQQGISSNAANQQSIMQGLGSMANTFGNYNANASKPDTPILSGYSSHATKVPLYTGK